MPRLNWTATGDYIDLEVLDFRVYEYFVANLNQNSLNSYAMVDFGFASLRDELTQKFQSLQSFFNNKLKTNLLEFSVDPTQQQDLNSLHRAWVKMHQQYPNIGVVFDQVTVNRINKLIHAVEELCQDFKLQSGNPNFCFDNPFDSDILKHGIYNLVVDYNNLGRTSYNKWINGDAVNDTDTNNFREFYTELRIRVRPSECYSLPQSYQSWCQRHNFEPTGSCLPLANFDKLDDNLLKYRQLVLTNSLLKNNFIFLE